jgi:ketosteroid isomerase-like protein
MSVSRMTIALAVFAMATMVGGCATTGGPSGPTPVESATAVLAEFHEAAKAQDVEKMMAVISEDFSNSQGDKQSMRSFMEGAAAQGIFEGMVINVDKCEVVFEGDSATAKPVGYETMMGNLSYTYTMKKEADGVWRIVSSEQIY